MKIYEFGRTHPGSRMLIVRKTRRLLTESALATWEQDVCAQGHPMLRRAISRHNRHQYTFPNRAVLVTGGMDHPDKVVSTEGYRV